MHDMSYYTYTFISPCPSINFYDSSSVGKNDYFSIGVILKSDLRIYDAQSQDGNLTHFNKNIYLIVTAIED